VPLNVTSNTINRNNLPILKQNSFVYRGSFQLFFEAAVIMFEFSGKLAANFIRIFFDTSEAMCGLVLFPLIIAERQ
jgi:hypothetical protein